MTRSLANSLICVALLLLAGCPARDSANPQGSRVKVKLPQAPDQFDQLAGCLGSQGKFEGELERLQSLYADPPRQDAAPRGDNDARYGLSSSVEKGVAELVLADRYGGPDWRLVCWESPDIETGGVESRVTPQADGLKLELVVSGALSVTILARWVNGRYLQVSREILLGGTDDSYDLHAGGARWRVAGQWLPYRMLPGAAGPFGVASDNSFSGEWIKSSYPAEICVPAAAAYSKSHGILLASGDRGGRDLSRNYDLSWRLDKDYKDGAQLEMQYSYFDGVQDAYVAPRLISGLPVRDSVILEPFQLYAPELEPALVEAQTTEVIEHLGALSRSFWFTPKPPIALPPGSAIAIEEWVSDPSEVDEALRKAVGTWNSQLNEVALQDAKLGQSGYAGIGAADIGGAGIAADALPVLDKLNSQQLPTVQFSAYGEVAPGSAYGKRIAAWCLPNMNGEAPLLSLDLRNPQAAAWVLRKHVADLQAVPQVAGYRFPAPKLHFTPQAAAHPAIVSQAQAGALLQLALAEQCATGREDAVLAFTGMPTLAVPACGNAYALVAGTQEGVSPQPRHMANVAREVFGVEPWLTSGPDASLASQVIATTSGVRGHALPAHLATYPGFEAFAANLNELRTAGGELGVLHIAPLAAGYTANGEAPGAGLQSLIACLPANWSGTRSVWIAFERIGGSITLDSYNELTVSWEGGTWSRTLPGGMWTVEHPNPKAVEPGDVVLVKFSPIKVPTQQGGTSG